MDAGMMLADGMADGLFHFEKSGRWPFRHPWDFLVKRRANHRSSGMALVPFQWDDHFFQELVWKEAPNDSKNNDFLWVFPSTSSTNPHWFLGSEIRLPKTPGAPGNTDVAPMSVAPMLLFRAQSTQPETWHLAGSNFCAQPPTKSWSWSNLSTFSKNTAIGFDQWAIKLTLGTCPEVFQSWGFSTIPKISVAQRQIANTFSFFFVRPRVTRAPNDTASTQPWKWMLQSKTQY